STDDTKAILERRQKELPIKLFITDERKGYQQAVLEAVSHATKPSIFIVDSDYQFAAIDFRRLEPSRRTHDVILELSQGYNFPLRGFLKIPYCDMGTGCRLIRRTALTELAAAIKHMSFFTAEFVVRAHYAGFDIAETPVPHYARKIGSTNIF